MNNPAVIAVIDDELIEPNASRLFNKNVLLLKEGGLTPSPGLMGSQFTERYSYLFSSLKELTEILTRSDANLEDIQFIQQSRIRLCLLIDTPGGINCCTAIYEKLIENIRKNGGRIEAYMGIQALSAGQILACMADERMCLAKSRMMIHKPQCYMTPTPDQLATGLDEVITRIIREGHEKSVGLLKKITPWRSRAALESIIRSHNPDSPNDEQSVTFTGSQMSDMGMVSSCFDNVYAMASEFESRTGIRLEDLKPENPVRKFFLKQQRNAAFPSLPLPR